jgi:ubiquinone/menaquinone biosynthesis C-methylase UbiE
MSETDKQFTGSIAEIYERYLVPLIFEPYANDMAARLFELEPREVLETAAGTGVLTRAITRHLGSNVRLTATDLNQPMLDMAAARQPPGSQVVWRQADALALPFQDQQFDAVACQFGVMFFSDKILGYREAHRVLKPGGRFVFNVWDRISENEFADVVTEALKAVFPSNPPNFMARTPHGYFDVTKIREELATAGFSSVSTETSGHLSKAASPHDVAIAYCQGTPLRNEIMTRDAARLEEATQRSAEALANRFGEGPIEGRIRAHILTAVR